MKNLGFLIMLSTPLRPLLKCGGVKRFCFVQQKKTRANQKNECDFRVQRPQIVLKRYFSSKHLFESEILLTSVVSSIIKSQEEVGWELGAFFLRRIHWGEGHFWGGGGFRAARCSLRGGRNTAKHGTDIPVCILFFFDVGFSRKYLELTRDYCQL